MRESSTHPQRSFNEWRDTIAPIFDVQSLAPNDDSGFHAELSRHHLGVALVGDVATTAQRYERSESLIGAVGVDHLLIQLYEIGHTVLDLGKREAQASPGDVLVFDLSRPVRSHASDMRAISLVLPRSLLNLDGNALDQAHGAVLSGRDPLGQLAGDHLRAMHRAVPTLDTRSAPAVAKASAQLLAACLSPSLMRDQEAPATMTATVAKICRFIDLRIGDPTLDARTLCSAFGLSRSALYRLFAPTGGVLEYIRRRRLARARLSLNASTLARGGIKKLARQFGFSSDEAFSRSFRSEFGISPREAAQQRLLMATNPNDDSLTNWMQRLIW